MSLPPAPTHNARPATPETLPRAVAPWQLAGRVLAASVAASSAVAYAVSPDAGPVTPNGPDTSDAFGFAPVSCTRRPAQADLAVFMLGAHRVLLNDVPVAQWPSSRARAVFIHLVLHRQHAVSREALMTRFWPDARPHAARNNLNVAIHGLRRALEHTAISAGQPAREAQAAAFVLYQEGRYLLSPLLNLWVDVEALRAALLQARAAAQCNDTNTACTSYQSVLALHQQPLLAGEPADADWHHERQQLQAAAAEACEQLAVVHMARGDLAACIAVCQRALQLDACNEAAHRDLMRCYARTDRHHLALRQYALCCESLARELNTTPGLPTVRLHDQVRRHLVV